MLERVARKQAIVINTIRSPKIGKPSKRSTTRVDAVGQHGVASSSTRRCALECAMRFGGVLWVYRTAVRVRADLSLK